MTDSTEFWLCGEDLPAPENRCAVERSGRIRLTLNEKNDVAGVKQLNLPPETTALTPLPRGEAMSPSAGFIGFVVDAVQKIAYCEGESRQSEVGVRVLDFLSSWGEDPDLARVVRALHVVYPGQRPTGDEAEHLGRYARRHGRSDSLGMPSAILAEGVIEDASDIALRSLSWGFLIDLDNRTLQFFDGSLKRAAETWRLDELPDEEELLTVLGSSALADTASAVPAGC